jgi:hypothetical protein
MGPLGKRNDDGGGRGVDNGLTFKRMKVRTPSPTPAAHPLPLRILGEEEGFKMQQPPYWNSFAGEWGDAGELITSCRILIRDYFI